MIDDVVVYFVWICVFYDGWCCFILFLNLRFYSLSLLNLRLFRSVSMLLKICFKLQVHIEPKILHMMMLLLFSLDLVNPKILRLFRYVLVFSRILHMKHALFFPLPGFSLWVLRVRFLTRQLYTLKLPLRFWSSPLKFFCTCFLFLIIC
jgi:hypothetical protein